MIDDTRTPPAALEDLPNVGKATAADLRRIGIEKPHQLRGKNPRRLYDKLCLVSGTRQDPCVLDVFMAVVHFVDGGSARPWWTFTAERKKMLERSARRSKPR